MEIRIFYIYIFIICISLYFYIGILLYKCVYTRGPLYIEMLYIKGRRGRIDKIVKTKGRTQEEWKKIYEIIMRNGKEWDEEGEEWERM